MNSAELDKRVPGRTLRLEGELPALDGGWFGTTTTAAASTAPPPAEPHSPAPDMALLQRVLDGLTGLLTSPPPE